MSRREQFEKFAIEHSQSIATFPVGSVGEGEYIHHATRFGFECWLAGVSAGMCEAVAVVKTMGSENAQTSAPVQPVVHTPRMAMADCSLRGKDSRMCLATVTAGKFVGEDVCVMVQYTDGFCICDIGVGKPMEILRIENLRPWIPVQSVSVDEHGRMLYVPI